MSTNTTAATTPTIYNIVWFEYGQKLEFTGPLDGPNGLEFKGRPIALHRGDWVYQVTRVEKDGTKTLLKSG